ncbi:MAG: 3-isopropylmalate dehydratase small subunit [Bacteroidales bacterium]|nr:3-isopropylmalate dehydratase small subunit [Bacteroidales bacterium]MBQ3522792.1 3-isopropylmalate dehydratase small subunit [Bacteroidales bacterium]
MGFEKIDILTSTVVATQVENIDTDQIIPARFLKATKREGFGEAMFRDWRYTSEGKVIEDSVFAKADKNARILVAGKNFGCGSSREHAAWAIADYGFRAVVSSFFADIFKNNALNNGLLPVQVSEEFLQKIFSEAAKSDKMELVINLPEKSICICSTGDKEFFPIGEYKRHCLENGLEDIDYLITTKPIIEDFEKNRK